MKKYGRFITAALAVMFIFTLAGGAFAEKSHEKRIRLSAALLREMAAQEDALSMADLLRSAKGVAIFPNILRTGFITGSQKGEGVVFLHNDNGTWTGPAFFGLFEGSIGLQIGIQQVGLVMVITNENGLHAFTGGNSFKLGADVGIAAGPTGRNLSAATDGRAQASIYTYSIAKGLFAGVAVDGAVINQNRDASLAYWGKKTEAADALKNPATDARVAAVISELNALIKKAAEAR